MIRTRPLLRTVLAAALLAGGAATFAVTSNARALAQDQDEGHAEHGALEEVMNGLKGRLRKLGSSIGDPASDTETLESLAAMQALALAAKPLDPQNLSSVPAAERAAHKADFRRDMAQLLRELADLEILVLDGKHAEAKERIKTNLIELRNSAHDKFQEK